MKILTIVGYALFIVALIGINGAGAAATYELSIYAAFPPLVWVCLIASIACGMIVAVSGAQRKQEVGLWVVGLALIVLSTLILLLLPVFRDYAVYGRSDIGTHLGYITDTLSAGHIMDYEPPLSISLYPALHVLLPQISSITGLPPIILMKFVMPGMYLMYVLFVYLLAKTILPVKGAILATLAGTVLLIRHGTLEVLPFSFSLFMIPLLLYLYFNSLERKDSVLDNRLLSYSALFLIVLLSFTFLHPLTCLLLIGGLGVMEISKLVRNRMARGDDIVRPRISANIPLILLVSFTTWLMYNWFFWSINVKRLSQWVKGELEWTALSDVESALAKFDLSLFGVIEEFFKLHGHAFIFTLLSAIAIIIIARRVASREGPNMGKLFTLAWLFVFAIGIALVQLFASFTDFGYWRILALCWVVCPIFVGFVLSLKKGNRVFKVLGNTLFPTIILLIALVIGFSSFYPSPWLKLPNSQITHQEIEGMKWFSEYKSRDTNYHEIWWKFRIAQIALGVEEVLERPDLHRSVSPESLAPDHFNYVHGKGDESKDVYLLLSPADIAYHTEVYPKLGKFHSEDFEKLYHDSWVDRLFCNGEFSVWRVREVKEQES